MRWWKVEREGEKEGESDEDFAATGPCIIHGEQKKSEISRLDRRVMNNSITKLSIFLFARNAITL